MNWPEVAVCKFPAIIKVSLLCGYCDLLTKLGITLLLVRFSISRVRLVLSFRFVYCMKSVRRCGMLASMAMHCTSPDPGVRTIPSHILIYVSTHIRDKLLMAHHH